VCIVWFVLFFFFFLKKTHPLQSLNKGHRISGAGFTPQTHFHRREKPPSVEVWEDSYPSTAVCKDESKAVHLNLCPTTDLFQSIVVRCIYIICVFIFN